MNRQQKLLGFDRVTFFVQILMEEFGGYLCDFKRGKEYGGSQREQAAGESEVPGDRKRPDGIDVENDGYKEESGLNWVQFLKKLIIYLESARFLLPALAEVVFITVRDLKILAVKVNDFVNQLPFPRCLQVISEFLEKCFFFFRMPYLQGLFRRVLRPPVSISLLVASLHTKIIEKVNYF